MSGLSALLLFSAGRLECDLAWSPYLKIGESIVASLGILMFLLAYRLYELRVERIEYEIATSAINETIVPEDLIPPRAQGYFKLGLIFFFAYIFLVFIVNEIICRKEKEPPVSNVSHVTNIVGRDSVPPYQPGDTFHLNHIHFGHRQMGYKG